MRCSQHNRRSADAVTKRDWNKTDRYDPDPGRIGTVPDVRYPVHVETSADRERKAEERSKKRREQIEKSEAHDMDMALARSLRLALAKRDRGERLGLMDQTVIKRGKQRGLF